MDTIATYTRPDFRYILYARKSSEDEGAQEKSLPDQIAECKRYAEQNHLRVVRIIKEAKSAKKSNNRPQFNQMLEDIRSGKADAILAWHPDRLARNSLESGIIIDMIDAGIIKDIKMPTTAFENNASGKLLLNILFAMSKEYSEHLSESVLRANQENIERGISSGTPKWGYERNTDGKYEPDSNFELIKKGWEMRAEGKTLEEITKFWIAHNVHRMTKINKKNKSSKPVYLRNKSAVGKIFSDSFYYGKLIQAGREVWLPEKFSDFMPMITEDTYNKVQALSRARNKLSSTDNGRVFLPFRGIVVCKECRKPMNPGASGRKGRKKLYFECKNKQCPHRASIRARVILDELYEQLETMKVSEKEYALFRDSISKYTDEKKNEILTEVNSLTGVRKAKQKEADEFSQGLARMSVNNVPKKTMESVKDKLNDLWIEIADLDNRISELREQVPDSDQLTQTEEEFSNVLNSVSDKMKAGSPFEKDQIARILLSNIVISPKKEPFFLWKEPFNEILKRTFVLHGPRGRT